MAREGGKEEGDEGEREGRRTYMGRDPMRKNVFSTVHMSTKKPSALLYSAVSVP